MSKLELKVPPPVVALVTALLTWWVAHALPALAYSFPGREVLAGLLLVAGLTVNFSGIASFRRAATTINPIHPDKASTLVVTGIFRFTRNPMYLGLLLVLTAWAVQRANLAALAFPVLFVLYVNRFQIGPEERILTAKFGADYTDYCRRVRRW